MKHLVALFISGLGFAMPAVALTPEQAAKIAPLPESAKQGGLLFADLNDDGHEDLIVSNPRQYGVYLYNPVEKKNVQWSRGWTEVLREGVAGDPYSVPLLIDSAGKATGLVLDAGDLKSAEGKVLMTRQELLRVPGPPPLSAEESLKKLQLRAGYTVSLAAKEPLVQDPVFVDWDEKGRMWVVEMGDYPFAPGEKTTDGRGGGGKVSPLQSGRIKILEDTDGDHVYDRATVFLDGLRHPTGLAFWNSGVFISAIPEIVYARDKDGDGKCDQLEPWFKGFTAGNPQHLVNGFAWGLDGWLYGANGDSGGEVTSVKTGRKVSLGTYDFRFHPDTGEFRLETGRSQYGKWRDDYGNWFGNNNSTLGWHYHIPMSYMEAHPDKVPASIRTVLNPDVKVFTISPPVKRFNHAGATHVLTAACSPMPWNDGTYDALLICEPANNLIRRDVLDYAAFPLASRRHPDDAESEFLASKDNWFRPTQVREGPDGALYVVDMYRMVLEHPEWIPAGITRGIDLRAGEELGRIYRISGPTVKPGAPARALEPQAAMRSSIRWQRDAAQRRLLEKRDLGALPWLKEIAQDETLPLPSRLQAAWTAALLDESQRAALISLLEVSHPRVRGVARVAAGSQNIHPDELAVWFPARVAPGAASSNLPVLTRSNPDRARVVKEYLAKVAGLEGNVDRGEKVYQKACIACHQLGHAGVEVGPNLATVAAKPVEQLMEAILDPNRAVEHRNATTRVTKKDGSILAGLIAAETPGAISLRLPGGVDLPVLRSEIGSMKTLPISLMPDGLESIISPQDMADLLARLRKM
ncbi:PVC-type heme-binding CxxCH protein [Verrucomicrobium sp. BvORR034]|uniref:PVC-type heme-binding CxxCH protein n=1 Tax=Verrucomicrobium sp. BvORR034 TaxID=1396418 RepID=UPI0006797344|nr:PVC-type heme-binding CxxCH protein [Verrucomicrobium sp. BvORR034]